MINKIDEHITQLNTRELRDTTLELGVIDSYTGKNLYSRIYSISSISFQYPIHKVGLVTGIRFLRKPVSLTVCVSLLLLFSVLLYYR